LKKAEELPKTCFGLKVYIICIVSGLKVYIICIVSGLKVYIICIVSGYG